MDLIAEIHFKLERLRSHASLEGVTAATRHIEFAQRWFERAREDQDDDLYNDAIYRTNQAFEGMLKEAYQVLTGKEVGKLTPHKIEQHLLDENVFTSRVLDLFKNYRQQWRNPSTHDHRLVFGEEEALLAIVSVSAFAAILLDQIIERINFIDEKKEIKERISDINYRPDDRKGTPFHDNVIVILELFSNEDSHFRPDTKTMESEILGRLSGFIESLDPSIKVIRDLVIADRLRPDLILEQGRERLLVEIKRAGFGSDAYASGKAQVLHYLEKAGLQLGILYIPPFRVGQKVETTKELVTLNDKEISFYLVAPSRGD